MKRLFFVVAVLPVIFSCRNTTGDDSVLPSQPSTSSHYIVRFDPNGAEGTMEDQRHIVDDERLLRLNQFTYLMHDFTGWYTEPGEDGKGAGAKYNNGEEVKNIAKVGETLTLYAGWHNRGGYNQSEITKIKIDPSSSAPQTIKIIDPNWSKGNGETLEAIAKELEQSKSAITLDLREIAVENMGDLFTNIDRTAFGDDTALYDVENPDWRSDKNHAPINIETIVIPETCKKISSNFFANCIAVKQFIVPEKNEWFVTENGKGESGAGSILYMYHEKKVGDVTSPNADALTCVAVATSLTGTVSLNSNTKKIGHQAFYGSAISGVALPESLEEIDMYAFMRCNNLKSILFPASLLRIDGYAFSGCKELETVTFAPSSKIFYIGSRAFQVENNKLTSFTLPSSIKRLGGQVFGNSVKKIAIVFEDNVNGAWHYFSNDKASVGNFGYDTDKARAELQELIGNGVATAISSITDDYNNARKEPTEPLYAQDAKIFWFKL